MSIVKFKATVVAAPVPPFFGTRLLIKVDADQLAYGIHSATLAEGCEAITVDWGDGIDQQFAAITDVAHEYAAPGLYEVRISDDAASLGVSSNTRDSPFYEVYPGRLMGVVCNAQRLMELPTFAFQKSVNLERFDFSDSAIRTIRNAAFYVCTALKTTAGLPRGLESLMSTAFKDCAALSEITDMPSTVTTLAANLFAGCTSLSGRIDLPQIAVVAGGKTSEPFSGCTGGITEIHFKKANEEAIRNSTAFSVDPTLGTGTAVCVFDP